MLVIRVLSWDWKSAESCRVAPSVCVFAWWVHLKLSADVGRLYGELLTCKFVSFFHILLWLLPLLLINLLFSSSLSSSTPATSSSLIPFLFSSISSFSYPSSSSSVTKDFFLLFPYFFSFLIFSFFIHNFFFLLSLFPRDEIYVWQKRLSSNFSKRSLQSSGALWFRKARKSSIKWRNLPRACLRLVAGEWEWAQWSAQAKLAAWSSRTCLQC